MNASRTPSIRRVLLIVALSAAVSFAAAAEWRQVTSVPPWAPRTDQAAVVFKDKIWVLGGASRSEVPPGTLFNDVWCSSDGARWTLVTAHADWSPRRVYLCLAFAGKLWLFGAPDCWGANDLWYSGDGVAWTQVTVAPPWFPRWGFTAVVFDDKIWVIGGDGSGGYRNDVWCSSDGLNWTEVTPAAPWAARWQHISVVHNGKIWVIGGNACIDVEWDGPFFQDTWSSPDGVNWAQADPDPPYTWWNTADYVCVAYGGRIWLFRGDTRPWYTEDGATWEQGADVVPSSDNALTYASEMWVISGRNAGSYNGQYNDVWHSSDGVTWAGSDGPAPFGPRSSHASTVFDDKVWVLGGRSSFGLNFAGDVWSSPDGLNWTQATALAPWGLRLGHATVALNGSLWLIAGGAFDGRHIIEKNDVWYSSDGAQWSAATTAAPWAARQGHASVVHDAKVWVLGGHYYVPGQDYYYGGTTYYLDDAWQSTDGQTWTEATGAAPWGPRAFHTCVSYDGKIWLAGGCLQTDGGVTSMDDVWYSSDGTNWVRAIEHAPWGPRAGHTLTVSDGKMWLVGGATSQEQNDAWFSTDGINWTRGAETAAWHPRAYHTAASFDGKLWILGGLEGSIYSLVFKDIWCADDPRAFAFTTVPVGGWKEECEGLVLSVGIQGAAGNVTYQWVRDDETLDGQTSSVLTIPSLQLSDQGYYCCIVTDESDSKTAHESPHAYVQVFPAGSLPVSRTVLSVAIASIAVVASLGLYAPRIRQRKQQDTRVG